MEKKLFIISGCNGAGKTTAAITLLPTMFERTEFVNADNIARKLNPSSPEDVAIEAGRMMLARIDELINDPFLQATFSACPRQWLCCDISLFLVEFS